MQVILPLRELVVALTPFMPTPAEERDLIMVFTQLPHLQPEEPEHLKRLEKPELIMVFTQLPHLKTVMRDIFHLREQLALPTPFMPTPAEEWELTMVFTVP